MVEVEHMDTFGQQQQSLVESSTGTHLMVFPVQSLLRKSKRYRLIISCSNILTPQWPMATGKALQVLLHSECTVAANSVFHATSNVTAAVKFEPDEHKVPKAKDQKNLVF